VSWYDDFHCVIVLYVKHSNVNICILEVCMVINYVITECKGADLWSFDVSGGATEIGPSTRREHPTGGTGMASTPF